jgi:ribosomal-protein-alanine N-acetyltransferase
VELIDLDDRHVAALAALEKICFADDPWPAGLFASALASGGVLALGLCQDDRLQGAALGRVAADEAELHSIAVHPVHRGEGWGKQLLGAFLDRAARRRARVVWLEVRVSNEAAIRLYQGCGFRATGRRPRYYGDGEDALIFRLDLEPAEEAGGHSSGG